jgi:hypothetical protein
MPGPSFLDRTLARVGTTLDSTFSWDKLPLPLSLLSLIGLRDALRQENLFDSYEGTPPSAPEKSPGDYLTVRTVDGSYNDLDVPSMGMVRTRFGRNVPLAASRAEEPPQLLDPNPRLVSRELLVRHEFKPATSLNILAAAWLQFQTRDWFSHGTDPERSLEVPPAPYDGPTGAPTDLPGDDWDMEPMRVPATPADETATGHETARTFLNTETHWWDGSQIYGSTEEFTHAVRTGREGKVRIGADGLIDLDPTLLGTSGGADGWWLGLELMTTVFMREHNAICDRLRDAYPAWDDDQVFAKARLVNAALMAKIHTVEWTPAILGHPALQIGMRANWFGLAGERVHTLLGRLSSDELVSGIPGSPTAHHAAPYSITEDFVAVYRMHPLIPDEYAMRDLDGSVTERREFETLHGIHSHEFLQRTAASAALLSLGTAHPGAVTLHNHPRFMHRFVRTDGLALDLAAVDILRSRERGVPRYNEFRRFLRMHPARSFEEMSNGDPATAEQLADVYGGDVDKVDATVGMYGERLPAGFGFSDTAFRIFILMASRRLKSDRFYTVDFTPRVYTPEGMAWLEANDMCSVLLRHYPELAPVLRRQPNAFAPWSAPS